MGSGVKGDRTLCVLNVRAASSIARPSRERMRWEGKEREMMRTDNPR